MSLEALGGHPSSDEKAGTSQGTAPPTPPGGKIYQAACPRCSQACRFTVPPGAASGTKLTIKCLSCTKPFAIQV